VLYEPGMSCRLYVCVNLVHCVMLCWQINDDDDDRLVLITNRKSYTGFRLAPNSMTLNDLECQNGGFYGFFCRFRAATQVYVIHKVAPRN